MRILHVVHGYAPSQGGSQWLTQRLSEELAQRWGDEVTVFTTNALQMESFRRRDLPMLPPGEETINGVRVRRFAVDNRAGWLRRVAAGVAYRLRLPGNDRLRTLENGPVVPGLRAAIAASEADVVFATAFPLLHMYDAVAGAQQAGAAGVLLGALHLDDVWGYDRPMIYRAIAQSTAYIAHTTHEQAVLLGRGIDPAKLHVVGAGVDAAAFATADGAARRAQWGWGDEPVVASMGKQVGRKRYDVLVEAMRRVWAAQPAARLLIAGARSSASAALQAQIAALPSEQRARVTVLDDFAEADKPHLLAAADVFALPSGQESFGIAFVEAWACRLPVIGVQVGAIQALIEEGRDGLTVPYADVPALAAAILRLLDDRELAGRLGEAGYRKTLAHYTWPAVADQVRAVYVRAAAQVGRKVD